MKNSNHGEMPIRLIILTLTMVCFVPFRKIVMTRGYHRVLFTAVVFNITELVWCAKGAGVASLTFTFGVSRKNAAFFSLTSVATT